MYSFLFLVYLFGVVFLGGIDWCCLVLFGLKDLFWAIHNHIEKC